MLLSGCSIGIHIAESCKGVYRCVHQRHQWHVFDCSQTHPVPFVRSFSRPVPLTLVSTLIAAYFRSGHPAGSTGYLLIVAFDVVLATVVIPLFGCYYTKSPSPAAALLSIISGAATRIILEFILPKDGFLVLPFPEDEFLDYGPAASAKFPRFFDQPDHLLWDLDTEKCNQERFEDYTGIDSLAAFFVSLLVFVAVQIIEHTTGCPLFYLPGLKPYIKEFGTQDPATMDSVRLEQDEQSDYSA